MVAWTGRARALLVTLNLWVSGGIWLELSNGLVIRSIQLKVPQSPAKSEMTGHEVTTHVAFKRRQVRGLWMVKIRAQSTVGTDWNKPQVRREALDSQWHRPRLC